MDGVYLVLMPEFGDERLFVRMGTEDFDEADNAAQAVGGIVAGVPVYRDYRAHRVDQADAAGVRLTTRAGLPVRVPGTHLGDTGGYDVGHRVLDSTRDTYTRETDPGEERLPQAPDQAFVPARSGWLDAGSVSWDHEDTPTVVVPEFLTVR